MNTDLPGARQSKSEIKETLLRIGAISSTRVEVFAPKTRDNPSLNVYRDSGSAVIFIEDYYIGDQEYLTGEYRKKPKPLTSSIGRSYEDLTDSERRHRAYRQFVTAKDVCDFGCGEGSFLKLAKPVAKRVVGIELQEDFAEQLTQAGIECHPTIEGVRQSLDVITLFHCLEHLPNPSTVLGRLRDTLKPDGAGMVIIEVPHARDFLIESLGVQEFINFTLWSQHLVLHTRDSLRLLLRDAGFNNVLIEGVQRYSLPNHLNWLVNKRPGGHKSILSAFQTPELVDAYANALAKIDATDTLVAIATT